MQCEKHGRKEEALAKIKDGVKFDEVARDFSEDKARQGESWRWTLHSTRHIRSLRAGSTGGSLGWKTKGSLDPQFEEVAFALETSTTSNPKIGEAKTPSMLTPFTCLCVLTDPTGQMAIISSWWRAGNELHEIVPTALAGMAR